MPVTGLDHWEWDGLRATGTGEVGNGEIMRFEGLFSPDYDLLEFQFDMGNSTYSEGEFRYEDETRVGELRCYRETSALCLDIESRFEFTPDGLIHETFFRGGAPAMRSIHKSDWLTTLQLVGRSEEDWQKILLARLDAQNEKKSRARTPAKIFIPHAHRKYFRFEITQGNRIWDSGFVYELLEQELRLTLVMPSGEASFRSQRLDADSGLGEGDWYEVSFVVPEDGGEVKL